MVSAYELGNQAGAGRLSGDSRKPAWMLNHFRHDRLNPFNCYLYKNGSSNSVFFQPPPFPYSSLHRFPPAGIFGKSAKKKRSLNNSSSRAFALIACCDDRKASTSPIAAIKKRTAGNLTEATRLSWGGPVAFRPPVARGLAFSFQKAGSRHHGQVPSHKQPHRKLVCPP